MCLSPLLIPNQNRMRKYASDYFRRNYDTTALYIRVPCGHCYDCRRRRQSDFAQRCYFQSLDYYPFFGTLTYSNDFLPKKVLPSGEEIAFADYKHIQDMFKRIRKGNYLDRDFKYAVVREFGGRRHRPHWHLLFFVQRYSDDDKFVVRELQSQLWNLFLKEWRINVGSKRCPDYKQLCEYHQRRLGRKIYSNYDLHFVDSRFGRMSDVFFYISKYIFKYDEFVKFLWNKCFFAYGQMCEPFVEFWNSIKPRYFASIGFGNPNCNSVIDAVNFTKSSLYNTSEFPLLDIDGNQMFLAKYYRRKFLDYNDADNMNRFFVNKIGDLWRDSPVKTLQDMDYALHTESRVNRLLSAYDDFLDIEDS